MEIKVTQTETRNQQSQLLNNQGRSKLVNWGGGGADIHIYVFMHHKNNRFQKKLIVQNTNI